MVCGSTFRWLLGHLRNNYLIFEAFKCNYWQQVCIFYLCVWNVTCINNLSQKDSGKGLTNVCVYWVSLVVRRKMEISLMLNNIVIRMVESECLSVILIEYDDDCLCCKLAVERKRNTFCNLCAHFMWKKNVFIFLHSIE